jgi:hypothetical protein
MTGRTETNATMTRITVARETPSSSTTLNHMWRWAWRSSHQTSWRTRPSSWPWPRASRRSSAGGTTLSSSCVSPPLAQDDLTQFWLLAASHAKVSGFSASDLLSH